MVFQDQDGICIDHRMIENNRPDGIGWDGERTGKTETYLGQVWLDVTTCTLPFSSMRSQVRDDSRTIK
jgi:hypothetical protein